MAWRFSPCIEMEREYRQQHLAGLMDNFRPTALTVLPFGLIVRIAFTVNQLAGFSKFSASEISVSLCRLCILSVVIYIFYVSNRFEEQKIKLAIMMVWCYRSFFLVILAQEFGLQQDQSEITRLLFTLQYFFVLGTFIAPTYEENLCMILAAACSKPIAYILTGSCCPLSASGCSSTLITRPHVQQAAILCAAAVANYVCHADRRRSWLASPRIHQMSRDEADPRPSSLPSDLDTRLLDAAAVAAGWEPLTAAERAAWHSQRRREAAEIQQRAARPVHAAAAWQCDGHVLGAGPCGYVLRAIDADGRFLALKQVTNSRIQSIPPREKPLPCPQAGCQHMRNKY
jgi:hypothetical protein